MVKKTKWRAIDNGLLMSGRRWTLFKTNDSKAKNKYKLVIRGNLNNDQVIRVKYFIAKPKDNQINL